MCSTLPYEFHVQLNGECILLLARHCCHKKKASHNLPHTISVATIFFFFFYGTERMLGVGLHLNVH